MVNCDGPTEQNCCLKCAHVSSGEFLFAPTISILSHQTFAALFYSRRSHAPPGPNSICLNFLHLQHICFNLTLSILEMRCNPVKPLFKSASQPRLFHLRSPVNSVAAALRGSHGPKSTDRTHTDGQTVSPEEYFLFYPPKQQPPMSLYQMGFCTIFLEM